MPDFIIWSAPNEPYEGHIRLCLEAWQRIADRFIPTLRRLFNLQQNVANDFIQSTILCHDIGKLTQPWQENIHLPKDERKKKYKPPHATLGAPYLIDCFINENDDLKNAGSLAILMHHLDSGLAKANLEYPAEDAINHGLVKYGTEEFRWAKGAEEAFQRSCNQIAISALKFNPLSSIKLHDLEKIAQRLRSWSRCPKQIEQHQHRLQALAIHHILKVCDWRAAAQRPQIEYDEDEEGEKVEAPEWHQSILNVYLEGGILP